MSLINATDPTVIPKRRGLDARLDSLDPWFDFQMTREQALQEVPRVKKELDEDKAHFQEKVPEVHKRDLPAAHRMGVNLEFVEHYGLYLPMGYNSTKHLAEKECELRSSQYYVYRGIGRAIHPDWLQGWNKPDGIGATEQILYLPPDIKEALFDYVRQGKGKKQLRAGKLAAEDALSLGLREEAIDWAIRAVLGQSTAQEKAVRQQREREKTRRKKPDEGLPPGLDAMLLAFIRHMMQAEKDVGPLQVLVAAAAAAGDLDEEVLQRALAHVRGMQQVLPEVEGALEKLLVDRPPAPSGAGPDGRRNLTREGKDRRGSGSAAGSSGGAAPAGATEGSTMKAAADETKPAPVDAEPQDQTAAPEHAEQSGAGQTAASEHPVTKAEDTGQDPSVQPQTPPEHWLAPVTREVKSVTSHEEQVELANHLVLAIAGRPPARVVSLVRDLLPRLSGAPEPVPSHLDFWIKNAVQSDWEKRWATLYDFFVVAQLPGFRTHLHCLYGVDIPDSCLPSVQTSWRLWPLEVPPLDLPEGASDLVVELVRTEHRLHLVQQVLYECTQQPREVYVELVSLVWERSKVLEERLVRLLPYIPKPEGADSG